MVILVETEFETVDTETDNQPIKPQSKGSILYSQSYMVVLCKLSIAISDIAEEETYSGIFIPESPESPLWFAREDDEKILSVMDILRIVNPNEVTNHDGEVLVLDESIDDDIVIQWSATSSLLVLVF